MGPLLSKTVPLVVPLRDEGVVREQREHVGADVAEGERDLLRQLLEVRQPLPLEQLQSDQDQGRPMRLGAECGFFTTLTFSLKK